MAIRTRNISTDYKLLHPDGVEEFHLDDMVSILSSAEFHKLPVDPNNPKQRLFYDGSKIPDNVYSVIGMVCSVYAVDHTPIGWYKNNEVCKNRYKLRIENPYNLQWLIGDEGTPLAGVFQAKYLRKFIYNSKKK